MNDIPSPDEALRLLKRVGCEEDIINHAIQVSKLAVKIGQACAENGIKIDLKLVQVGGLLHDIGRSITHDVSHGVKGAEILRSLKIPDKVVRIAEVHVGAGISKEEAIQIDLPAKDHIPTIVEEKIVCYADKLVKKDRVMDFNEGIRDMARSLGFNHPALLRFRKLHDEITQFTGVKDFAGHTNRENSFR